MKHKFRWILPLALCAAFSTPSLPAAAEPAPKPPAEAVDPETAKAHDAAMTELTSAKDPYERWCALGRAAMESVNAGKDADAKKFAEELESLAPRHKDDWNYGNAIQTFNIVFGRLAIKAGDLAEAKKRLTAAGKSPGSPQMDTFGPNMSLAKALLEKGEKVVVLEYFTLCKKFWKLHEGRLDTWAKDVEAGRTPDFGGNMRI